MVLASNSERFDFKRFWRESGGNHLHDCNLPSNGVACKLDQVYRLDSHYEHTALIQQLDHNDDNNEEQYCHDSACSHEVNNPITAWPLNQRIHLVGGNQKRI